MLLGSIVALCAAAGRVAAQEASVPAPAAAAPVTPAPAAAAPVTPAPAAAAPVPIEPAAPLPAAAPPEPAVPSGQAQASTPAPDAGSGWVLAPRPEHAPEPQKRFIIDPISDGAIISLAFGFAFLSELVLGTGEIVPQQPQGTSRLLKIDRFALDQSHDSAGLISTVAVGAGLAFAAFDIVHSSYSHGIESGFVDAVLYAETLALTWAATNIAKFTVRRPRPRAYQQQQKLIEMWGQDAPSITETDTALSFFSGHTAIAAALTGTATYLAFTRHGGAYPWIVLGVGVALTTFVGIQRVRSGAHFPTDVIAGAMAGGGIGMLVPHIHREETVKQQPVWIGFQPDVPGGRGGGISLSGLM